MKIAVEILPYIQIVLSVVLVILVLFQRSEDGIGEAFGGGESYSRPNYTRRGMEKIIYRSTIVIGVLFVASTLAAIIIH